MFDQFKEWTENRHEYAREWKARTGKKIAGYFCTYTPEEIFYAAGVLPVRILGSHEPSDVVESHIFGMFCPFCRDCLAQGLSGRYDYLDGITIAQCCLHMRQAFTSWQLHVPVSFSYYLPTPANVQGSRAKPYLSAELSSLKKSLEAWTGKQISNEDLDIAIALYNENRKMMRQVYEFRKSQNPPLTGLEAAYVVVSSQVTDKEEHNRALSELLRKLPERQVQRESGIRLLLVGSETDDFEFINMVESMGATFVIDDHCLGSRYFWNSVIPENNRLAAIAARYIDKPACPIKDWPARTRLNHILNLAKEYNVQGAMVIQQKFCDPHEFDIPAIMTELKEAGISSLFLEFDTTTPAGQSKTRVEAFLEMLSSEDLFLTV